MARGLRFWALSAATTLAMAATASLGLWQLSRAAQKEALAAGIEARVKLPALDAAAITSQPAADQLHRAVVLRGRWVAGKTVFLDNRQMHGKPGFYVLTPLQLSGQAAVVLVQRGWAPRNFLDRAALPPVATPEGEVEVRGRMAPPPAKLYGFQGEDSGAIRQNLDLAQFGAETRLPLLAGLSVVQLEGPADGLQRDWPQADSGVGKHYGYAFQWFALCGLLAVLYVWFQFIAPRRQRQPA